LTARVRRLAITSAWALGVIWLLWALTVARAPLVGVALALGWILMPTVLWASLHRPSLRFGLILPATLVTGGVASVAFGPLPDDVTRAGWLALLAGLGMGGVQGAWLWFGWFPVPPAFRDPLAKTRLRLIVAHVTLVLLGMVLVTAAALT
jgi:hypothetical protein